MVPVCLIKPDDCFVLQFEQALGSLPDSRLPVANQLEQAITTIKSNVKVILDIQGENKVLKKVGENTMQFTQLVHVVRNIIPKKKPFKFFSSSSFNILLQF